MSDNSETKWEYALRASDALRKNYDNVKFRPTRILEEMGEQGWELVGFEAGLAWFKRRMARKDGPQSIFEE